MRRALIRAPRKSRPARSSTLDAPLAHVPVEAAAPALITPLGLTGVASAAIDVVVLVLHQIAGVMQSAGELDRTARDQLYRLAQDDPAAVDVRWGADRNSCRTPPGDLDRRIRAGLS